MSRSPRRSVRPSQLRGQSDDIRRGAWALHRYGLIQQAIFIAAAIVFLISATLISGYILSFLAGDSLAWSQMPVIGRVAGSFDSDANGHTAFGTLVMAIAVILSAAAAFFSLRQAKRIANTNKTLDFISRQVHDRDLVELMSAFRRIRRKHEEDIRYDSVTQDDEVRYGVEPAIAGVKRDFDYILQLLNYYEMLAIGVKTEALDEDMLQSWWRSSYVRDVTQLSMFILQYRDEIRAPALYVETEEMAWRWARPTERKSILDCRQRFRELSAPKGSVKESLAMARRRWFKRKARAPLAA